MKQKLSWHQECLQNHKRTNDAEAVRISNMIHSLNRSVSEYNFYEYQIRRAIAEKKDGFDRDKYKKNERAAQEKSTARLTTCQGQNAQSSNSAIG